MSNLFAMMRDDDDDDDNYDDDDDEYVYDDDNDDDDIYLHFWYDPILDRVIFQLPGEFENE